MHSSIYDDALAQLHSNYQSLQENIINVAREQSRVIEMVSRIQLDLETYKETQNERFDDMLTNIDNDVRKVSQEMSQVETLVEKRLHEARVSGSNSFNNLKSEVELMSIKCEQYFAGKDDNLKENKSDELNEIKNELQILKSEVQNKFEKSNEDFSKSSDLVELSILSKIEEYINNEVVDEIVVTVNNRILDVKAELLNDIEIHKIKMEETNLNLDKLKLKVSDLELPKKGFNESELFASSVDLTRTPLIRQSWLRTPTQVTSSMLEPVNEESNYVTLERIHDEREDILDTQDKNVNVNEGDTPQLDVTLYEDIGKFAKDETKNQFVSRDSCRDLAEDLHKCNEIEVAENCSYYDPIATCTIVEDFGEKYRTMALGNDEPQFYSDLQTDSRTKRRDSIISNIFINLTNFLDV